MESFKKLGISDDLVRALADQGFTVPSEIQEKVIPLAVAGHDVIGSASTGSGKTLAFGANILDKIHASHKSGIQALIVAPTRELAEQIAQSLATFGKYLDVYVAAVYGGVSYGPQISAMRRADIVVGTPGRLLDHIRERTLDLKHIKFLVLDEADRMLDMGFIDDITSIIEACPKDRQTLLLSATMAPEINRIARKYMKEPKEVDAVKHVDPSKLQQVFYDVPQDMKFSLLVHLLKQEKEDLVMVFCNTRRNADFLVKNLKRYDIHAMAIHGGLSQNRRNDTLEQFHSKDIRVLVCTDVAARGLDIKGVSHVYNYDIPKNSKEYIHRIGRTARAGTEGIAVNLVSKYDYMNFRAVMSDEAINIKLVDLPNVERVAVSFKENRGGFGGGRGGFRGSSREGDGEGRGRSGGRSYGRGGGRSQGRGRGRRF
jgi:ATP-dependent RNA helicase DeaD